MEKGKEYDVTGFPTLFVRGMINNKKVDQEFNAIEHGDMANKIKQIIQKHAGSGPAASEEDLGSDPAVDLAGKGLHGNIDKSLEVYGSLDDIQGSLI